jgi:electron transfer flavoprotein alpha subunit
MESMNILVCFNTDPDAPSMAVADYAVIGDLSAVVPAISAEIQRGRG